MSSRTVKNVFPKLSKVLRKKNVDIDKEKTAELVCNINPSIWQRIRGNFLTDQKMTEIYRNGVLQKNAESTIDRPCK